MLGYSTNINGDRYPVILKSNIRFFLMISLKDIIKIIIIIIIKIIIIIIIIIITVIDG
jgi:hypothetical protein